MRGQHFVWDNIRRCTRNWLLIDLLLTCLVIAFVISKDFVTYDNYWFGPHQLPTKQLLNIPEIRPMDDPDNPAKVYLIEEEPLANNYYTAGNKYYFHIQGDQVNPISLHYITEQSLRSDGLTVYEEKRIKAEFVLLAVGDKLLVVKKGPVEAPQTSYNGVIEPLLMYTKMGIWEQIHDLNVQSKLLPFIFDATETFPKHASSRIKVLVFWLILWGISYPFLIFWYLNPEKHPFFTRLSRYGEKQEVLDSIGEEIGQAESGLNRKKRMTHSWIIERSWFWFSIKRNHLTGG